jgi:hypothetical protein
VDIKVFKTRAIFRARRRSRSVRNRASVLKTSYPRILYDIFFLMLNELTFRLHVSLVLSGLMMFPWKTRDVAMEKSVF